MDRSLEIGQWRDGKWVTIVTHEQVKEALWFAAELERRMAEAEAEPVDGGEGV